MSIFVWSDPGELTREEIEVQLKNEAQVPLWQMHPLVQHILRVAEERHRDVIEYWYIDGPTWIPISRKMPNSAFFLEAYRLKEREFDHCETIITEAIWAWENRRCVSLPES